MQRFVDDSLKQIDLGDGDFVKVPTALSFETVSRFQISDGDGDGKKVTALLLAIIKEWNLKLADGSDAEINEANLCKLDINTVNTIMQAVTPMFTVEKKD